MSGTIHRLRGVPMSEIVEVPEGTTAVTVLGQRVELARWMIGPPGYLPGACSRPHGGRVYCTPAFPRETARAIRQRLIW